MSILLLNYRGVKQTLACLDSLRHLEYPNYQVIVIDNASGDDSVPRLKARLLQNPGEFHLIESPENGGYSAGNNQGIRYVLTQTPADETAYVWLLNNDTTADSDSLTHLVQQAQETGAPVGSLLLYPDGTYQQVGTRINWWTGSTKGYPERMVKRRMPVESLTGASMLVPVRLFRTAGLLDESYFLYFEDTDFSLRCAATGCALTVSPDAKVFHEEGATTGRKSWATQYYYHRNRLHMLSQWTTGPQRITFRLYTAFRLFRSGLKSMLSRDVERQRAHRVFRQAVEDFRQGVRGPCPHNLEAL